MDEPIKDSLDVFGYTEEEKAKIRARLMSGGRDQVLEELEAKLAATHREASQKIAWNELLAQFFLGLAINLITAGFIAPVIAYILTYKETKTEPVTLLVSFGLCVMFALAALAVSLNFRNAADEAKGERQ